MARTEPSPPDGWEYPWLVEGMTDPGELVRRGCTSLMDHLADNRCMHPLFQALRDPDERVRRGRCTRSLATHASWPRWRAIRNRL
jgi:hypothetical protein